MRIFLFILRIIIIGYTLLFLANYIFGFGFGSHPNPDFCTFWDGVPLAPLFSLLLIFSLIFQILAFSTRTFELLKNSLMISLSVFGLLSAHNFLQIIFNNKSELLLKQPLFTNPLIVFIILLCIYWAEKAKKSHSQKFQPPTLFSQILRIVFFVSRIIFFIIFFVSLAVVLFYHSYLIYQTFAEHNRFVNEYNCGAYPAGPSVIPEPAI